MNIILVGFKKCGKSSLGKYLSDKLCKELFDVDHLIEKKYNSHHQFSYFEIYEKEGEKKFREIERQVICSLEGLKNTIIATGGGSLLDDKNLKTLKKLGKLLYLYLRPEVIKKRIQKGRVPSFLVGNFDQSFSVRNNVFQKNADYVFDISELSLETSANLIINKINGK